MTHRARVHMFALPLAALIVTVGCSTESGQKGAVTTRTDKGTSTAAPSADADNRDRALVRVVQAMPAVQSADVFADDSKVFPGVSYKEVTPYKEVKDDRLTFRVKRSNQDAAEPLAENSEMLGGGKHYTVVAFPAAEGDRAELKVLSDNLTPPSEGKAKVRVIHAAANAGEVDVYTKGKKDAWFDGVNFRTETMYDEIDPMAATIEVRPDGKNTSLLTLPETRFEAGKIYTIIVMGRGRGKLEGIVVEDQLRDELAQR